VELARELGKWTLTAGVVQMGALISTSVLGRGRYAGAALLISGVIYVAILVVAVFARSRGAFASVDERVQHGATPTQRLWLKANLVGFSVMTVVAPVLGEKVRDVLFEQGLTSVVPSIPTRSPEPIVVTDPVTGTRTTVPRVTNTKPRVDDAGPVRDIVTSVGFGLKAVGFYGVLMTVLGLATRSWRLFWHPAVRNRAGSGEETRPKPRGPPSEDAASTHDGPPRPSAHPPPAQETRRVIILGPTSAEPLPLRRAPPAPTSETAVARPELPVSAPVQCPYCLVENPPTAAGEFVKCRRCKLTFRA
jgi:hypothetical protein